jgi:hypothetical protein
VDCSRPPSRAPWLPPHRPAEWLVDRETTPPGREEIDLLARAVLAVLKDEHREAVIKCLYIRSAAQAGTFSTSAETIELLRPYPNDPKTRGKADSAVRSMWGAHKGLLVHKDGSHFANAIKWAKVFWGANSMTSHCMRRREFDTDESDIEEGTVDLPTDTASNGAEPAPAAVPDDGAHLRRLAMDLFSSDRGRRRSHPQTPSLDHKRRLRHLLALPPHSRTPPSAPGPLPGRPAPRPHSVRYGSFSLGGQD